MKWLGAILLTGACGFWGILKTAALRQQIELMDELLRFIRYLRAELAQRASPLTQMLENYPPSHALPLDALCRGIRQGKPLAAAAAVWLGTLEDEPAGILAELFGQLGRYDGPTQVQACQQALEQLEDCQRSLAAALKEKAPIYRAVPLSFGLIAALVLL